MDRLVLGGGSVPVEESLGEQVDRLSALVACVPGVVYRIERAEPWRMVFVSDAIEIVTGFAAQELSGAEGADRFFALTCPRDHDRVLEARTRLFDEAPTGDIIGYWLVDAAGDRRYVADHVRSVCDRNGVPRWLDGVLFDMTDQRIAAREVERLQAELQNRERLNSLGRLAAGVAHEMNTPLQFAGDSLTFVRDAFDELLLAFDEQRQLLAQVGDEALREQLAASDDEHDIDYVRERAPVAFTRAASGIARVSELVNALEAFAHDSPGALEQVDINRELATTLTIARAEIASVAALETSFASDLPTVSANAAELRQAILALINNAVAAIAETGRKDGRLEIASRHVPPTVRIEVTDNGCGMDQDVEQHAFDPFFTTHDVGGGTGLGLTLARAAVAKHGGTLTCDSVPKRGSTFVIGLPT
ncbi:MAG: ATP-binding protein [Actinomycetota bacterium]